MIFRNAANQMEGWGGARPEEIPAAGSFCFTPAGWAHSLKDTAFLTQPPIEVMVGSGPLAPAEALTRLPLHLSCNQTQRMKPASHTQEMNFEHGECALLLTGSWWHEPMEEKL